VKEIKDIVGLIFVHHTKPSSFGGQKSCVGVEFWGDFGGFNLCGYNILNKVNSHFSP